MRWCKADLPDHELVVAAVGDMVDVRRSEEVVRDIGIDVGVVVAPLDGGRDGGDIADEFFIQVNLRVSVALDLVVGAGPLPGGGPRDAGAGHAIDGRALGTRAAVLAPKVVVHGVWSAVLAAILGAELLGESSGGECGKKSGLHGGVSTRLGALSLSCMQCQRLFRVG